MPPERSMPPFSFRASRKPLGLLGGARFPGTRANDSGASDGAPSDVATGGTAKDGAKTGGTQAAIDAATSPAQHRVVRGGPGPQ